MSLTHHHQPDEARFRTILPEQIEWQPFDAFPAPVRLATLVGHPAKPGPYVIRVKAPLGVVIPLITIRKIEFIP